MVIPVQRPCKSPVGTTAPSLRHRSRVSSNNATFVVDMDIRDGEVGARLVARLAELAGNHHALDNPRGILERARDAREVARASVFVEENGALVLGDHVEVFRQGTASEKPAPSCTQMTCHGPVRWLASVFGSDPVAGPGFQERIWSLSVGRRLS